MPDTHLDDYRRLIAGRFANPRIGDTIQRLCLDGSNRQPKFILPSVEDRLRSGAPVTGLALVSALWCRYCYGVTDSGTPIAPNDPNWDRLQAAAIRAKDDAKAFLQMKDILAPPPKTPFMSPPSPTRWERSGNWAPAIPSPATSRASFDARAGRTPYPPPATLRNMPQ